MKKRIVFGLLFLSLIVMSTTALSASVANSRNLGLQWSNKAGSKISTSISRPSVAILEDATRIACSSNNGEASTFQHDDAPPVLGNISFYFTAPASQNISIRFSLQVSDNTTISSVVLYYRLANSSTWNSSAMSRSGTTYQTTIGPFVPQENVTYYFKATDTSGNFTCKPANAPTSFYSIKVPPHSVAPYLNIPIVPIATVAIVVVIIGSALLVIQGKNPRRNKTNNK